MSAQARKQRVDQLLVSRGLAESRTRAQALVMAGLVFSGETKLAKSGQTLAEDAPIEVRGRDHPWVSRGGIKLAHALDVFALDPVGAFRASGYRAQKAVERPAAPPSAAPTHL